MPPGVYVEEFGFTPAISGRNMTMAAFLGISTGVVGRVRSLLEFERAFGTSGDLWRAARAYFNEGGQALHIVPVLEWTPSAIDAALATLAGESDISAVAAPFSPASLAAGKLIAHADACRDRIALIDPEPGAALAELLNTRSQLDSRNAALYSPWIQTTSGLMPPSPFVAAVLSKTPPHKSPANVALASATGLEREIPRAEQEVLNPEGVNLIRAFHDRGILVWGARTLSRDPEWKYISIRRYTIYIEQSVSRGLQWTVFEPNNSNTWQRVTGAVTNFLLLEWRSGALQGVKPEEAFFVRCGFGQSMTQQDIVEGRLVLLIGIAPLKPAEFIIIRVVVTTVH